MMQGRLAALSSKYDIYLVPNFINMHYVSLDSHRDFSVEAFGIRKTTFHLTIFELGYFS